MNAAIDLDSRGLDKPTSANASASAPDVLLREGPGESVPQGRDRDPSGDASSRDTFTGQAPDQNASGQGNVASLKGTILRYKADRRPVAYVMFMFAAHLAVFALAPTWVAALSLIPFAILSFFIAPINHHHQHFNTFHSATINRLYEVVLSVQTGIGPYGWVLHHNLGHHRNYLNQRPHAEPDESKWTRKDGSMMGPLEYTVDLVLNHQLDIFRVGRRYPRFLRAYLLMKIPVWGFLGTLLYLNPANALLIFIIPAFFALVHTAYSTYGHHAGNYPTSHYDASANNVNPVYNFLTCNLGFHTAHHKRPGVHWSLLPKLHEEIKDEIPPELIQNSFWISDPERV